MPFGLSIFPGDQDWMKRVGFGTGIFGQQGGELGVPGTTPPTGSWADKFVQKLESPGAQLGLRILANNRGGLSTGNVLGNAVLGMQQDKAQAGQADLQRRMIEAQIAKLQQPDMPAQRSPVIVMGPDGKPRYEDPSKAIGQQPYQEPAGQGSEPREVVISRILNDPTIPEPVKKDLRGIMEKMYREPAAEPLVAIQTPDGRSVLVPRSQAVGASPAAPRENFVPTEGERTSGNYYGRMQAAEGLLGTYKPSMLDYAAAKKMMQGGAVAGSVANSLLSPEGQKYYQAAADWVRAKLRKESGAVISPEEMEQEIKTYFPMPGDGLMVIDQKARSRAQAMQGMKDMSGRAVPNAPAAPADNDPLGIR